MNFLEPALGILPLTSVMTSEEENAVVETTIAFKHSSLHTS